MQLASVPKLLTCSGARCRALRTCRVHGIHNMFVFQRGGIVARRRVIAGVSREIAAFFESGWSGWLLSGAILSYLLLSYILLSGI